VSALAPTTVYEPAPPSPDNNIATGGEIEETCRVQVVGLTDLSRGLVSLHGLTALHGDLEPQGLWFSTADYVISTSAMPIQSAFGWYVRPKGGLWSVNEFVDDWYVAPPRLLTLGTTCVIGAQPGAASAPTSPDLPSTHAQREEREATARLVGEVSAAVPDLSEADLADLVGVSRITWRGWASASRVARRASRQRILRLKKILELRRRMDPTGSVSHWLDTPVGTTVDVTPARLLAQGRDGLVAILAARGATPESEGLKLRAPMELGGLVDTDAVDSDLAFGRELYSADVDEGGDQ
jgi:hypothetical protein